MRDAGLLIKPTDGNGSEIFIASVETDNVSITSNITSYPVYSGDTVGEHLIREPITMTVRGAFSSNASEAVIIGGIVPSVKGFQEALENLRNNGTLCSLYKMAYRTDQPRFQQRDGMTLKSIYWEEDFNSVTFNLTFQQIMTVTGAASGPSAYQGDSDRITYSGGSEEGTYNAQTGQYTDPDTGEKINASRKSGEVWDEFGFTEVTDSNVPSFSVPYSTGFIQEYIDKSELYAAIIAFCCDDNIIDEAFQRYVGLGAANRNLLIAGIATGIGLAASAKTIIAAISLCAKAKAALAALGAASGLAEAGAAAGGAATAVGMAIPSVLIALLVVVATGVAIYFLVKALQDKFELESEKKQFKKAIFKLSQSEEENQETTKKFFQFIDDIYDSLQNYDQYFLVYDFPNSNRNQQATLSVAGVEVKLEIKDVFGDGSSNGLAEPGEEAKPLAMTVTTQERTYNTLDITSAALDNYNACTADNAAFKIELQNDTAYGYVLKKPISETLKLGINPNTKLSDFAPNDPQSYAIVISTLPPKDFAELMAEDIKKAIAKAYNEFI